MASPSQWTWVWVNSGSWWWTGRPGMLWFIGSQRVGHDWTTELNWVRSWVQEDFTCCRAAKPVHHNYWACVPQLLKPVCPRACTPQEKPLCWEVCAQHLNEEQPPFSATREGLRKAMKTQCSQKFFFVILLLVCTSFYIFLVLNPYQIYNFQIFLPIL